MWTGRPWTGFLTFSTLSVKFGTEIFTGSRFDRELAAIHYKLRLNGSSKGFVQWDKPLKVGGCFKRFVEGFEWSLHGVHVDIRFTFPKPKKKFDENGYSGVLLRFCLDFEFGFEFEWIWTFSLVLSPENNERELGKRRFWSPWQISNQFPDFA